MTALLDAPARLAAALVPGVWCRLPTGDRRLYLTFDDGPSAATDEVLDALARHGARASFFVLDEALARHPGALARLRQAGHTAGSHGRRHTDPWRHPDAGRWTGLARAVRWLRPPFGHLTPGLVRHARRKGQRIALWDAMPGDFRPSATPETVEAAVRRRIRPGSLVALHDGPAMAARIGPMLDRLLPVLQAQGWTLAALPEG